MRRSVQPGVHHQFLAPVRDARAARRRIIVDVPVRHCVRRGGERRFVEQASQRATVVGRRFLVVGQEARPERRDALGGHHLLEVLR